ncbi:MAG: FHA domain-containing protein [Planctomycetota bacterium]|jgi:pSer/pThr/pTyr-binding forkhead associated (FHA) protein
MRLRLFPPSGAPVDFDLSGSLAIGRDKKNDITIGDGKASSKHAVIEVTRSGKVQLRDLGSTNGTTMNGTKVEADLVVPGDVIMIGEHRFMLWEQDHAPVLPADDPKGWRLVPRGEGGGPPYGVIGSLTVGRSPECGLPIDDVTVSAHHATITVEEHGLSVEDHGSSNGTWVGGTKVRRSALKHGDVVAFGDVAFFAQHGNRELPQVKAAERKTMTLAIVAVISIIAAGIFGITVLQNRGATPPGPGPKPPSDPSTTPTAAQEGEVVETDAKAGVLSMDRKGRFAVNAATGAQLRNGAVVLLDDDGAVVAHQHDADPGPGKAALRAARTAEGLLAPRSDAPTPFKLSGGLTPSGLLTLTLTVGTAGTRTIAGLRIDCPSGTIPVSTTGPEGEAEVTGAFSVAEAEEILLSAGGKTFALAFDTPWSVRGRPANGGWELLIWKRGTGELSLDAELGGRPLAEQRELARLRSRAEAAMQREEYADAVKLWTELRGRYADDDPAAPELDIRLEEARSAASSK